MQQLANNCFKPYKGVSSNVAPEMQQLANNCFKPYKGVSSNELYNSLLNSPSCFKPYKGVSSNNWSPRTLGTNLNVSNPIREYLQIKIAA